jgi:hypothetical protein
MKKIIQLIILTTGFIVLLPAIIIAIAIAYISDWLEL